jgi:hypothetical protein
MEAIVPSGVTRRKRGSDHSGVPTGSSATLPQPRKGTCFNGVIDPITGDLLPDVVAALMNNH